MAGCQFHQAASWEESASLTQMEDIMSDNSSGAREALLEELALRLSTFPRDPRVDNLQLLVGQLPANLALGIPLPDKSQALGTLILSPVDITIELKSESF